MNRTRKGGTRGRHTTVCPAPLQLNGTNILMPLTKGPLVFESGRQQPSWREFNKRFKSLDSPDSVRDPNDVGSPMTRWTRSNTEQVQNAPWELSSVPISEQLADNMPLDEHASLLELKSTT